MRQRSRYGGAAAVVARCSGTLHCGSGCDVSVGRRRSVGSYSPVLTAMHRAQPATHEQIADSTCRPRRHRAVRRVSRRRVTDTKSTGSTTRSTFVPVLGHRDRRHPTTIGIDSVGTTRRSRPVSRDCVRRRRACHRTSSDPVTAPGRAPLDYRRPAPVLHGEKDRPRRGCRADGPDRGNIDGLPDSARDRHRSHPATSAVGDAAAPNVVTQRPRVGLTWLESPAPDGDRSTRPSDRQALTFDAQATRPLARRRRSPDTHTCRDCDDSTGTTSRRP